eukprot:6461313-Amphidinium_carterae.1
MGGSSSSQPQTTTALQTKEEQTCRDLADLLAKLQQQDDAAWKREALRKLANYFHENQTLEARQAM